MEKIFIRDTGTQVKLVVWYANDNFNFRIFTRNKGKRIWNNVCPEYDEHHRYQYGAAERILKVWKEYVTPEELYELKLQLWESFKPKIEE